MQSGASVHALHGDPNAFLKSRRGNEGVSMCSFSLQEATPKPFTALMPCYELSRIPDDPRRSGLGNLCGGVAHDVSHRPAAVHNPDSSPLMAASRRFQVSSQRHTTTSLVGCSACTGQPGEPAIQSVAANLLFFFFWSLLLLLVHLFRLDQIG